MKQGAVQPVTIGPVEALSSDPVGFGKHGELTYNELWLNEPGYCQWTMNKFKELVGVGDETDAPYIEGDSKIKRLAQWIINKEAECEANGPAFEYKGEDMELVEVPGTRTLKERVAAMLSDKPPKFYGIALPEKRVCTSWEECKKYVHGVKGVMYRSFGTREDAEAYVNNPPERKAKVRKQPEEGAGASSEAPKTKAARTKKAAAANADDAEGAAQLSKVTGAARKVSERTGGKRRKTASSAAEAGQKDEPGKVDAEVSKEAATQDASETADQKADPEESAKAKAKAKAKVKAKAKAKAKAKEKAKLLVKAAAKKKAAASSVAEGAGAEKHDEATAKAKEAGLTTKSAKAKAKKDLNPAPLEDQGAVGDDVMKRAEVLGMGAALKNLSSRPDIASLALSGEVLLSTLQECEGLVNKARSMLLTSGPSTPVKSIAPPASTQKITPEKPEVQEKQFHQDMDELKALLGDSAVLKEVADKSKDKAPAEASEATEADESNAETKVSVVEQAANAKAPSTSASSDVLRRIQENRERALARKKMLEQKVTIAGGA
eukprot:TRINITY_DN353_c0_g1_i3.p1 TRINITY_DN353_c0_g1~~TRINITY_DN353_c0_g1_i3.p1  ORF type:complete len:572 (+),score=167.19 TRINITY_DN353_c0_g1_i3:70-1716(+)